MTCENKGIKCQVSDGGRKTQCSDQNSASLRMINLSKVRLSLFSPFNV